MFNTHASQTGRLGAHHKCDNIQHTKQGSAITQEALSANPTSSRPKLVKTHDSATKPHTPPPQHTRAGVVWLLFCSQHLNKMVAISRVHTQRLQWQTSCVPERGPPVTPSCHFEASRYIDSVWQSLTGHMQGTRNNTSAPKQYLHMSAGTCQQSCRAV